MSTQKTVLWTNNSCPCCDLIGCFSKLDLNIGNRNLPPFFNSKIGQGINVLVWWLRRWALYIPLCVISCGIIITDGSNTFQYFVAWGIIIIVLYNILELRSIKISSKYYWKKMTRIKTSHVVSSGQNNIQQKFIV